MSAARRTTVGGHLAAQAIASVAAALFLALTLRFSFISRIPTALRLGAGCGISVLVGVLGMRGVGLLLADSFTLQPFTWESVSSTFFTPLRSRAVQSTSFWRWLSMNDSW